MAFGKLPGMLFYLRKRWLSGLFLMLDGWSTAHSYWGDGGLRLEKQSELTAASLFSSLPLVGCCSTALFLILSLKPETETSEAPLKNHIKFCVLYIYILVYIYLPTEETINWILGANLLKNVSRSFNTRNILYKKTRHDDMLNCCK